MPQGLVRGDVDLRDVLYDGREEGGRLVGGLGQLVDGHKGSDNFHVEVYGPGKVDNIFHCNNLLPLPLEPSPNPSPPPPTRTSLELEESPLPSSAIHEQLISKPEL
ncbi:hypothetical protein LSTR_LSTR016637 [Laodelphax striatellus]|uniref:Discoidin domain-containing protein n=1 Tax=Laodelphax striatellus TaxID=195883 RepID=A0A482X049_LAOST|nr:hypothetical protein LSTR_LSTR016637 [Laodelphax striatellus]